MQCVLGHLVDALCHHLFEHWIQQVHDVPGLLPLFTHFGLKVNEPASRRWPVLSSLMLQIVAVRNRLCGQPLHLNQAASFCLQRS